MEFSKMQIVHLGHVTMDRNQSIKEQKLRKTALPSAYGFLWPPQLETNGSLSLQLSIKLPRSKLASKFNFPQSHLQMLHSFKLLLVSRHSLDSKVKGQDEKCISHPHTSPFNSLQGLWRLSCSQYLTTAVNEAIKDFCL